MKKKELDVLMGLTKRIYDNLQDDKSKTIFMGRLKYNLTKDDKCINGIVNGSNTCFQIETMAG